MLTNASVTHRLMRNAVARGYMTRGAQSMAILTNAELLAEAIYWVEARPLAVAQEEAKKLLLSGDIGWGPDQDFDPNYAEAENDRAILQRVLTLTEEELYV